MEKIVIIGASYLQLPLIKKVKQMGYETHVFAWSEGAVGFEYIDKFYPISIREIEAIYQECLKIKPKAVVSIASDLANITVHTLARRLGLPCNSEHCVQVSTNKFLMRQALQHANIPCPKFHIVQKDTDLSNVISDFSFPVIVKPTDRSGSRAITKVFSAEEIQKAVDIAVEQSFEKRAIIEEFLEGEEYSAECISFNGVHTLLNLTKKFTTGSPNFIETGHLEPAQFDDVQKQKIERIVKRALNALDIKMGASHTEFKVDELGNVGIVEIGSRMGGDFIGAELVNLSTNQDFVKMVIDTALGIPPTFGKKSNNIAGIKYILNENDYKVIKEFIDTNPKNLVQFELQNKNFDSVVVDSGTRLGYAIFKFDDYEQANYLLMDKER